MTVFQTQNLAGCTNKKKMPRNLSHENLIICKPAVFPPSNWNAEPRSPSEQMKKYRNPMTSRILQSVWKTFLNLLTEKYKHIGISKNGFNKQIKGLYCLRWTYLSSEFYCICTYQNYKTYLYCVSLTEQQVKKNAFFHFTMHLIFYWYW